MKSLCQALLPGLLLTVLLSVLCYMYVDDQDEPFYFISALTGGLSLLLCSLVSASLITKTNIRATYKARHTIRFSYKVAHRCGIAVTYFSMAFGALCIYILLTVFKSKLYLFSENNFSKK
jgi:F0F1-type ATP synthase assembly protein I